jgi:hypothetical protein
MPSLRVHVAALAFVAAASSIASAQPTLAATATTVEPGATITLTITGSQGQNFALIGSTVGSGFSYGGTALEVGADVAIIAQGVIGAGGQVALGFTPPFAATALDRYYVQAVTSASPSFVPLQASAGLVLRNADIASVPVEMGSNTVQVVQNLVGGDNFIMATAPFVATRDMRCLITSSMQVDPSGAIPLGNNFGFFRNAASRNGTNANDDLYGQYLQSNGLITRQDPITRSSVMTVGAGQTVRFGAFLGSVPTGAAGAAASVQTSYLCQ